MKGPERIQSVVDEVPTRTAALTVERQWLDSLAARGVTSLCDLSADEVLFLRSHREAIRAAARSSEPTSISEVTLSTGDVSEPTPAATAPPCEPDASPSRSEVRCTDPELLAIVNYHTKEERDKRHAAATSVMLARIGKPSPWNY